jgi:succinate-semialdehyde dehydrogenase/glutarate-semialdehyde dehydrogenase
MYEELAMYIDGEWCQGSDGAGEDVINPATEEALAHLPHASSADLDGALAAAGRGFAEWRATSAYDRGAIIYKAGELIRERADAIAETLTLEQGKVLAEARLEVLVSADIFQWYAEEGRRAYGRIIPSRIPGARQMVVREPVGPVAAFTPWNFPAVTPARKIAGALGAGCSCIIKPSEETPGTTVAMVRALEDAGLPAGVMNLVFGVPSQVSEHLIGSPIIRKVTFTGSIPVGKLLTRMAAEGMKRTTMELGGHAPVIVFDDVDVDKVTSIAVTGKYRNAGQVCVSPTRFFVQDKVYKSFVTQFAEKAAALKVGDGLEAGMEMGPLHGRRADRQSGLLLRAHGARRRARRGAHHERGAVRAARAHAAFLELRRRHGESQRAAFRPRGLCLHHLHQARECRLRCARERPRRRQPLRHLVRGDAFRRRQGKRPRRRRRYRGAGGIPDHEVHHAAEQLSGAWLLTPSP